MLFMTYFTTLILTSIVWNVIPATIISSPYSGSFMFSEFLNLEGEITEIYLFRIHKITEEKLKLKCQRLESSPSLGFKF